MLRRQARRILTAGPWRPSSARHLLRDALGREERVGPDAEHLRAASDWLARAQAASDDGGVAGRYFLGSGWSPSYPETTGYLVPTFLALADALDDVAWRDRAERAIGFLLPLQMGDGAFPGGEIGGHGGPSVFNTGQILHGLLSWGMATGDASVFDAARRAGRWLCDVQEPDGSFRRATYLDVSATYHAHAVCWLADAGLVLDDPAMLAAARRHLAWCLGNYDGAGGWLDLTGFTAEDHAARRAVTHTFAYALFGVLHTAQQVGMPEGVEMARDVAGRAAALTIERGRLPGVVSATWDPSARYTCLTGSAQMGLLWSRLHEVAPAESWERATTIALDEVKRAQPMRSADPGIRGGIPGSRPIWGDYIPFAFPNWAAKFFVDALLVRDGRRQPGRVMPAHPDPAP